MKFEYVQTGTRAEWMEILAVPEESDGYPPVRSLIVFLGGARDLSPDRLAAAATIAFHPWVADSVNLARAMSPLTAQRMVRCLQPMWASVGPVMTRAYPIPRGTERVTISQSPGAEGKSRLSFVPIRQGVGVARRGDVLEIPANASVLDALSPGVEGSVGAALLAAAALVAEIIGAASVEFEGPDVPEATVVRFAPLLEAAGLAVSWRPLVEPVPAP